MRLNPTKDAAKQLGVQPPRLLLHQAPSADHWLIAYRHLCHGAYFLCSNEVTLWSTVVTDPRPAIAILVQRITSSIGTSPGPYLVESWTNRRVIGSMNDMHRLIEATAGDLGNVDAAACERLINSTPFSYLGMKCPLDAIDQLRR